MTDHLVSDVDIKNPDPEEMDNKKDKERHIHEDDCDIVYNDEISFEDIDCNEKNKEDFVSGNEVGRFLDTSSGNSVESARKSSSVSDITLITDDNRTEIQKSSHYSEKPTKSEVPIDFRTLTAAEIGEVDDFSSFETENFCNFSIERITLSNSLSSFQNNHAISGVKTINSSDSDIKHLKDAQDNSPIENVNKASLNSSQDTLPINQVNTHNTINNDKDEYTSASTDRKKNNTASQNVIPCESASSAPREMTLQDAISDDSSDEITSQNVTHDESKTSSPEDVTSLDVIADESVTSEPEEMTSQDIIPDQSMTSAPEKIKAPVVEADASMTLAAVERNTGLRQRGIYEARDDIDEHESSKESDNECSEKVRKILAELRSNECDRERLKQFAISPGGLVNKAIRKIAWPKLLEVDLSDILPKPDEETLRGHRDYEQVVLDVNRSLKRFPPGMEDSVRLSLQDKLVDCIMRVLCARPELHYYQGYHDIVVTFLLVLDEDHTFALMNELSMRHLRDFMYESMDKTTKMLHYLYPLIGKSNPELRHFMEKAEVGTIFALSWLITWFGHVLGEIRHIVRLYDFFIASDPLMPIYLAASVVLYRADEILCCEPEMPIIHCLLSKIPPDLPIERLIREAEDLSSLHPPESIEAEAKQKYQEYLEENEKKRQEVKKLTQARQGKLRRSNSWFGYQRNSRDPKPSKSRTLVKVTVYTSAAILSAAALTFYWNKVNHGEAALDFHWLWGGS